MVKNILEDVVLKTDEVIESGVDSRDESSIIKDKVNNTGLIVFAILYAVISILSLLFRQSVVFYAVSSLYWLRLLIDSYSRHVSSKTRLTLVTSILYLVAFICFTISFVLNLLVG